MGHPSKGANSPVPVLGPSRNSRLYFHDLHALNPGGPQCAGGTIRGAMTATPRQAKAGPLVNAFSVDVEDYFQVAALAPAIAVESWPTWNTGLRPTPRSF